MVELAQSLKAAWPQDPIVSACELLNCFYLSTFCALCPDFRTHHPFTVKSVSVESDKDQ